MATHRTMIDLVTSRAEAQGSDTAYTFLGDGVNATHVLTYGALESQARAVAVALRERVKPGDRAVLLYPPGLDFVVAFLACQLAGVVAVPVLPPRRPLDWQRFASICADAGAAAVCTVEILVPVLQAGLSGEPALASLGVVVTDVVDVAEASRWRMPDEALRDGALAFLQYTSGSTGVPKGVMVSHANLLHNESLIQRGFGGTQDDVSVSWLPQYHDMGLIGAMLQPLYVGARCVLFSPLDFLQQPVRWLRAISRYRGTASGAPNFAYALAASRVTDDEIASLDLSSWRLAFNGAEPVRLATLERFAARFAPAGFRREAFAPCYGLAESTVFVSSARGAFPRAVHVDAARLEQHALEEVQAGASGSRVLVACGAPIGQTVRIVDPATSTPCAAGSVGEIWIAGASVACGYWNRPEATREAFHARIAGDDTDVRFLRTGDLGVLHHGELFVTGRLKELVIVDGRNHYPHDLEETVQRGRPALRAGCGAAFAIEADGAERLVVVQEVASPDEVDLAHLAAEVRAAVAEEHGVSIHLLVLVPGRVVEKTTSGKIRRRVIRDRLLDGQLPVLHRSEAPASPTAARVDPRHPVPPPAPLAPASTRTPEPVIALERQVAALIAPRVGLSEAAVDRDLSFAACGLDSRALVSLSGELETALGRRLEPQIFYNHSTIRTLARFLAGHEAPRVEGQRAPARDERDTGVARPALAIVGMACRFPGAPDLTSYWELLTSGRDAITDVPPQRWSVADWFDPDPSTPGKMATRWGGFLEDVDAFDAEVFGTSPREAESMDPQQRIMLQLAWHALEDAGISPEAIRGTRTGVFVGASGNDYARLQAGTTGLLSAHAGTGNALSIIANRLSYFFDLRGPSLAIDTACSSSLAALHEAAVNLAAGECDQALVGGINLLLAPDVTVAFSQNRMMAADGRCKSFAREADGYVRSEGGGVVVVKRLEDAVAAGDHVWAVLAGTACNQDGRSNGLTAPRGGAQEAVVKDALLQAGWEPRAVQFVETHGTGTRLGDPIEAEALGAVYGEGRDARTPLVLGAVKSQIGHLEAAAGMAGLIKTALCLAHGVIPANLHAAEVNPLIRLDAWRLALPAALGPWPAARPRRAGVSAFGFGGTNAHVLLEEAPAAAVPRLAHAGEAAPREPILVLPLSARTDQALGALSGAYARLLANEVHGAQPEATTLCNTAGARRHHFREARRAVVGATAGELARALVERRAEADSRSAAEGERRPRRRGVAFLFTGQGAQYVDMGRGLYETEPVFRDAIDACDRALAGTREVGLRELLYPPPGRARAMDARLAETDCTQPALFALEHALAKLWLSWGVEPGVMMGHSVGEIAAAAVAGVFSLEDGLRLVEARGRLMHALPEAGGMLAVFAHERDLDELLPRLAAHATLSIGAYNGPGQLVLSGALPALERARLFLKRHGIDARALRVSHAFHSALMEPMLAAFREVAETVRYHAPSIPIVSNLTGALETTRLASAAYWVEHARAPVRFAHGVAALQRLDVGALLEIGPRPVLTGMARRMLDGADYSFHSSLAPGKDDARTVAAAVAALYEAGVTIDWRARTPAPARGAGTAATRAPLYPFATTRYWFAQGSPSSGPGAASGPGLHPLLGRPLASPRIRAGERHFASDVRLPGPAFFRVPIELAERRVSLLAYLEIALEAQRELFPGAPRAVRDLRLEGLLVVPRDASRAVQTLCEPDPEGGAGCHRMEVWTQEDDGAWRRIARATLSAEAAPGAAPEPLASLRARIQKPLDVDAWYETTRESGLQYCASPYPAIRQMWWAPSEVLAEATPREEDDVVSRDIWLKHSVWNVCNQVMGALCPRDGLGTYFPVALEAVRFGAQPGRALVLHGRLRPRADDGSGWVVDVTAYSEEGAPVAVVEGVRMIPDQAVRTPRSKWRAAPPEARADLLAVTVQRVVARVLRRPEADLPRASPLLTLGLDSLTAVEIATRLEQLFEVGINIAALQQGASVHDVVGMLEGKLAEAEGWTRRVRTGDSPLVDLNRGDASLTPLFLVHPIGGAVFCYQELARHLGAQPLIGVQSPALTGAAVTFARLEEMAAHHLAHVRARQAEGPYRLAGWSLGGVLAFEMARQLEASGEEVECLILLDALAPGEGAPRPTRGAALHLLAGSLGIDMGGVPEADLDADTDAALEILLARGRAQIAALRGLSRVDLRRMLAELEANLTLLGNYAGDAYKGTATLLRAERPLSPARPDASGRDWSRWLASIDALHTVPGDHFGLLSGSHVILTASYFRKALNALAVRDDAGQPAARERASLTIARDASSTVITPALRHADGALRAGLVIDEAHPFFFDHALDHVSGVLILEGLLQLVEASQDLRGGFVHHLRATFPRFCEKDRPVTLELLREAAGAVRTARALQVGLPVCTLKLQTDARPSTRAPGRSCITQDAGRADPALLHKTRADNVLIAPWTLDGGVARTILLPPPRGHQLDAGDPRDHSPLYPLEAARQLVTGLSHAVYGVPLGMPMNLVGVELVLDAPLPRAVPLALSHALQPPRSLLAPGASTFAHFEVDLAHPAAPDDAIGHCRITAQLMTREAYLRVRAKGPRAAAA